MSPAAEQLFLEEGRLPAVPQVMQEVLASLRKGNISVAELAALVSNDQVISAKVLRLANSSYYGATGSVASISAAVRLIGMDAFRNLAIACSLVSAFPAVEGFDLAAFWRHSMLVGNLAHVIGRDLDVDRDALFCAGLMHGLGLLLLWLCLPEQAGLAAEACQDKGLTELRDIERASLGTDRFELGMELARRWNFPESIQAAIGYHDQPGALDLPAQVVHVSVLIAQGIEDGLPIDEMLKRLPAEMAKRVRVDRQWFEEQGEVFDQLLQEAAALA